LDATPLRHFLGRNLDCDRIQANIKRGNLYGWPSRRRILLRKELSLYSSVKGHPTWQRAGCNGVTKITVDTLRVAAIPMIFEPVQ